MRNGQNVKSLKCALTEQIAKELGERTQSVADVYLTVGIRKHYLHA